MFTEVLNIISIAALFIYLLFLPTKRKIDGVKIPKDHNDTSNARYAINEHGFLEEIHRDKLSNRA